jgi:hypothetical protein
MKIDIYYSSKDKSTMFTLLESIKVGGWEVPEGTTSNGASVPRILWAYCSPLDGRYLDIFCWHDWAYAERVLPRSKIDQLMRQYLIARGMSKSKAYTIYYAVRCFGDSHYDKV